MNKEEFLKKLKKKLDILEDKEVLDIVSEYEGYIDEKVASGLTEEEAIKELGDFDEIISDLLAAYKLKDNSKNDSGFNKFVNTVSDGIDNFMGSLDNKSGRDIIKVLIEIIIILFIVCLLKIPFSMIKSLGGSIFDTLPRPFSNLFTGIWYFIIEFSYIVAAIVFFIKTFEKRYFKDFSDHIVINSDNKEEDTLKEEKPKKKKNTISEVKHEEIKETTNTSKSSRGIIDVLVDICMGLLKFVVVMFLFGVVCYLIGISIAVGIMIYLMAKGVTYFGIFILLLGLFFGGVFILELGIKFISNKKIRGMAVFSKLVALIILTGVGLSLSAIEIANTEIIYDSSSLDIKTISKEITMTDNLALYNYDRIVIDNSLGNVIKIEYNYPDYGLDTDLKIKLERVGRGYALKTDVTRAKWNKKILDKLTQNLKDKKIYTYDFRLEKIVYMSEDSYNKIIKNDYTYYDNHHNNGDFTFTRKYYIENIEDSGNNYYLSMTLKEMFNNEIGEVTVAKNIVKDVLENNSYLFTFQCDNTYDDDIEELFNYCKILDVKLVNNEA